MKTSLSIWKQHDTLHFLIFLIFRCLETKAVSTCTWVLFYILNKCMCVKAMLNLQGATLTPNAHQSSEHVTRSCVRVDELRNRVEEYSFEDTRVRVDDASVRRASFMHRPIGNRGFRPPANQLPSPVVTRFPRNYRLTIRGLLSCTVCWGQRFQKKQTNIL